MCVPRCPRVMGGRQCGVFPPSTCARIEALCDRFSGSGGVFRRFYLRMRALCCFGGVRGKSGQLYFGFARFSGVKYILAFSRPGPSGEGPPGPSGCTGDYCFCVRTLPSDPSSSTSSDMNLGVLPVGFEPSHKLPSLLPRPRGRGPPL